VTSTATRPSSQGKVRTRHARKKQRRRWPLLAVLGLVVALVLVAGIWAWWLVSGLLDASRVVQDKAAVAQAELQAFRDTLKAGDEEAATAHLDAGQQALDEANEAAQVDQVRTAKGLPWVGKTVADLDHLLAAAGIMTDSGRDAMVVYQKFSGEDSELFDKGKFSIPAIREAQDSVTAIRASMDRAEAQLRQVTGEGPKGDQALEKKRSALAQIASLRAEIDPLEPVLKALPSAVGADGPVKYLVAVMNPA
jgi:cell division protein FtsB